MQLLHTVRDAQLLPIRHDSAAGLIVPSNCAPVMAAAKIHGVTMRCFLSTRNGVESTFPAVSTMQTFLHAMHSEK